MRFSFHEKIIKYGDFCYEKLVSTTYGKEPKSINLDYFSDSSFEEFKQSYTKMDALQMVSLWISLLLPFDVPWGWAYYAGTVSDWIAKYSFGFYSLMLTSTLIVKKHEIKK